MILYVQTNNLLSYLPTAQLISSRGNNKQARAGFPNGLHLAQCKGLFRFEIYFQTALTGIYLLEAVYEKAHHALTGDKK